MTFETWVGHHAERFAITQREELLALKSWRAALNATPAELYAATDWLVAHPDAITGGTARFAGKMAAHLGALLAKLGSMRAVAVPAEALTENRGECKLCSAAGMIGGLPDLRFVVAGEWRPYLAQGRPQWATVAVFCHCALGAWKKGRVGEERQLKYLSLDRYETCNPGWRDQIARRDAQAKEVRERLREVYATWPMRDLVQEQLARTRPKPIGPPPEAPKQLPPPPPESPRIAQEATLTAAPTECPF